MPNSGSWNGRWSGEKDRHCIIRDYSEKDFENYKKNLIGTWFYRWDDGWTACINGDEITRETATKLKRLKTSFCGYDWMVGSIVKYGKIMTPNEAEEYLNSKGDVNV